MKAELEELEGNLVRVNIELSADEVERALEQAYRKVVRDVDIPGFRKGKAPRPIVERFVGSEVLQREALENLVPSSYADAIDQLELEPIDNPEIDIDSFDEAEGLEFHADVQVKPKVTLGDYRGVEQEYTEPEVTEEVIDEELEQLREASGQLMTVEDEEATLQEGYFAVVNFEGFIGEQPIPQGSGQEQVLEIGSGTFVEGFEEQLVGMKPGEEREVTVTFPEDYGAEELAGETAVFDVELLEIKEKQLPELDDELLEELGPYESVEALRADIRERLQEDATREAEQKHRNEVVAAAVDRADVSVPEVLIERRTDELLEDLNKQFERQNFSMEAYLQQTGQSVEELREEFRERAERDVKTDLVLEAIAEEEEIGVDTEDMDAELQAIGRLYGQSADALRAAMLGSDNSQQLRQSIKFQKTVGFLTEIAAGTEPEEALAEATRKYHERLKEVEQQAAAQQAQAVQQAGGQPAGEQPAEQRIVVPGEEDQADPQDLEIVGDVGTEPDEEQPLES